MPTVTIRWPRSIRSEEDEDKVDQIQEGIDMVFEVLPEVEVDFTSP